MPSPEYKGTRVQLNVWVEPTTSDILRKFAKSKGFKTGQALDYLLDHFHKTQQQNQIRGYKDSDENSSDT